MVSLLDESIAELKPNQAAKPPAKDPTPPPKDKWAREGHAPQPVGKPLAAAEDKDDTPAVAYQVNDTILAKWVSGDKGFYPARITSITGSSAAPIYIVKFKSYDTTETLRAKDIRPISNKRKADGTPASASSAGVPSASAGSAPASTLSSGVVASAAASVYPEQQAKKDAELNAAEAAAKPPKPKKIKGNKVLEAGKNKWQDFNTKSKFGKTKKESMFRTPEGVHGRG